MIELMIAVTLGLLLTAAVLQTFVSMKRTYVFNEEFSRIQENGRFAIEFLTRDIRGLGFWGCFGKGLDSAYIRNHLNNTGSSDDAHGFDQDLEGTNGATGSPNSAYDSPDTLILRSAQGSGINVIDVPATPAANLKVSGNSGLEIGDIVLVSDCSNGEIFQITKDPTSGGGPGEDIVVHNTGSITGGHQPENATKDFQKIYGTDAKVFHASNLIYTVSMSNASGLMTLYRNGEEIVPGIENLQILYGQDTGNDNVPDYFIPAGTAGLDFDEVVSIHISLLVSSMRDQLTEAPQNVDYNGAILSPGDRRIRKVFSTQIALRNRLD